jgi:hypothetical protein
MSTYTIDNLWTRRSVSLVGDDALRAYVKEHMAWVLRDPTESVADLVAAINRSQNYSVSVRQSS